MASSCEASSWSDDRCSERDVLLRKAKPWSSTSSRGLEDAARFVWCGVGLCCCVCLRVETGIETAVAAVAAVRFLPRSRVRVSATPKSSVSLAS